MNIPNTINRRTEASDLKTSTFMILINPNLSSKTNSDEYVEGKLRETIGCVFNNSSLSQLVRFRDAGHAFNSKYIKDIDIEYVIERGSNKKFIHSHILLTIKHKSNIQLKIPQMRAKVGECLFGVGTEKKYFFSVKIVKNNNYSVRYYMDKDLRVGQLAEPTSPTFDQGKKLEDGGTISYV